MRSGGGGVPVLPMMPIDRWVDAAQNSGMNPLVAMLVRRAAEADVR